MFSVSGKQSWIVVLLLALCLPAAAQCPGEQRRALATMERLESQWPLRDPYDQVSLYVNKLGERIARAWPEGHALRWRFTVLRDLSINAFAIGNGKVYVTEGVLRRAGNESELAAVLAHEIGHQLAGHFCRPEPGFWRSLSSLFSWHREERRERRVTIGGVTQVIDPRKEFEADEIAVRLLEASGYDPHALLAIARLPAGGTHLDSPERIQGLNYLLAGRPPVSVPESARFQEIRRLLEGG